MTDVHEISFGHRKVCVYRLQQGSVPLIYSIDYNENGRLILDACNSIECSGFNLVTVSALHWDQELSPWAAPTVVSQADGFTGGADGFLELLTTQIVPQVEQLLDAAPAWRGLSGYSLGGLFAFYAGFKTDMFTRLLSASGSMWYPGLEEFVQNHRFIGPIDRLYLSLGDKESTSKNAVLQTTEGRTRLMADMMAQRGIDVKFELNPGNHFKNPPLRIAKGIKWLLEG